LPSPRDALTSAPASAVRAFRSALKAVATWRSKRRADARSCVGTRRMEARSSTSFQVALAIHERFTRFSTRVGRGIAEHRAWKSTAARVAGPILGARRGKRVLALRQDRFRVQVADCNFPRTIRWSEEKRRGSRSGTCADSCLGCSHSKSSLSRRCSVDSRYCRGVNPGAACCAATYLPIHSWPSWWLLLVIVRPEGAPNQRSSCGVVEAGAPAVTLPWLG